jgi:hypothetical protein
MVCTREGRKIVVHHYHKALRTGQGETLFAAVTSYPSDEAPQKYKLLAWAHENVREIQQRKPQIFLESASQTKVE